MVPVTAKVPLSFKPDVALTAMAPEPVMASTVVMTPLLKVKVPLLVMAPAPKTPPVFSCKLAEAMVVPPVYMLLLVKMTVPLLVESPTVSAPVPAPEMMPLKVAVLVVPAASLFAPVVSAMALLMVLVAMFNKEPPPSVTPPDERWLPLAPPEATDKVPPEMVVPPVKVLAPPSAQVPAPSLVNVPLVVPKTLVNVPPAAPPKVKPNVGPVMVSTLLMVMAPVPPTMELAAVKVIRPE